MSTLAEIETAIAQLPPQQRAEIRRWMDRDESAPNCAQPAAGRVDWTKSAAATRQREPQACVSASVVAEALAAVRA